MRPPGGRTDRRALRSHSRRRALDRAEPLPQQVQGKQAEVGRCPTGVCRHRTHRSPRASVESDPAHRRVPLCRRSCTLCITTWPGGSSHPCRTVPQGLNSLTVTVIAPGVLPPRDSWAYFSCYPGLVAFAHRSTGHQGQHRTWDRTSVSSSQTEESARRRSYDPERRSGQEGSVVGELEVAFEPLPRN
jgi:hypothetical protein